jgi:dienelactone hydrolase
VKKLQYIDPESVIAYGCSSGGSLVMEVAAATEVCAIVPEEPSSLGFTGIVGSPIRTLAPRQGESLASRFDGIMKDLKRYYTTEHQKFTRAKIDRIHCPILIIQGDKPPVYEFNNHVLIPELRNAKKTLDVITYAGEPHCFCFQGGVDIEGRWQRLPPAPHAATALKAFHDINDFSRRYVVTQPKPIESRLVKLVPVTTG